MRLKFSWVVCGLLLLTFTCFDGCHGICGCRNSSMLYIQYKAPVSGWYKHSPMDSAFIREFNLSVTISEITNIQFILAYKRVWGKWIWLLYENSFGRSRKIANFAAKADPVAPLVRILCPATTCACRALEIRGAQYIDGLYYRKDIWKNMTECYNDRLNKLPEDSTFFDKHFMTTDFKENCCQDNRNEENEEISLRPSDLADCVQRDLEVIERMDEATAYVKNEGGYQLTQAPEGDFWWFEANEGVYGASKDGAPCPTLLPTDTKWLIVNKDNNFDEPYRTLGIHCIC